MEIPREKLLELYRFVLLTRKVDDKLREMNLAGLLPGLAHLGAGQEAMPVAVGAILRKDDYLKSSHRVVGSALAKGISLKSIFASSVGRVRETKQPESFAFAPEYGIMGMSGSLGEDIPIYVGLALSSQIKGEDRITVCFFGDGTSNRGPVHESMNLASIWKLPIVFICENNQYAVSMPTSKAIAATDIADRAAGYGMPGVVVDGNDVIACYEVAYDAIKRSREGGGASFIEAKTYRLRGHYEGDEQLYRTKEEVEEAEKKEPVGRFRESLLKAGVLTQQDAERLDTETTAAIEEAAQYALSLPLPDIEAWTSKYRR